MFGSALVKALQRRTKIPIKQTAFLDIQSVTTYYQVAYRSP